MFAVSTRPKNPEVQTGELLLLQLNKQDASRLGLEDRRVNFALVFEKFEFDHEGTISRTHSPKASKTWDWIIYGIATVPTIPFSLENLDLSRDYTGMDNLRLIAPEDEAKILPFIQWSMAEARVQSQQLVPAWRIAEEFGQDRTLQAIYNHDRIATLSEPHSMVVESVEYERSRWLADSLKSYYLHRCQICSNDFEPSYGVRYSESHHIQYLSESGLDISQNLIVLCPNHHRIIHETRAEFDRAELQYQFPDGRQEKLANAGVF